MKKSVTTVFVMLLATAMLLPLVKGVDEGLIDTCVGNPTLINGQVYSGDDYDSPTVPDAMVDVMCNGIPLSDMSDAVGYYSVVYEAGDCPLGSNVSACVGDTCGYGVVETCFDNQIDIENIDIFNVPEFGMIAGGIAIAGAIAGFMFLRKRN